jgi:hypothetical protein
MPWASLIAHVHIATDRRHASAFQVQRLSPQRVLATTRLGTDIPEYIPLPIETRYEHRPAVLFTNWLARGNDGGLVPSRGHVPQGFAETALTELIGTAEELDRIIDVEGSEQKLHRPKMLIAQWKDVAPHGPSLASAAKQNPRREPRVFDLSP